MSPHPRLYFNNVIVKLRHLQKLLGFQLDKPLFNKHTNNKISIETKFTELILTMEMLFMINCPTHRLSRCNIKKH